MRESAVCPDKAQAELDDGCFNVGLGTSDTGPSLARPYAFADVEPLNSKRMEEHFERKRVLAETLRLKWAEATSGPPRALPEVLDGGDEQFRPRLLLAQGKCAECLPLVEAQKHLLSATYKESTKEAEAISKDYRLNPVDGILERSVLVTRVEIWVLYRVRFWLPRVS